MKPDVQEAITYFAQQKNYFWRWADGGQVIEWQNGSTICYRAELVELMRQLEGQRIVPFSSIILFLAACSEGYKTSGGSDIIKEVAQEISYAGKKETEILLNQSLDFMEAVSGLPKEIKNSVVKKAHIIHECFQLQHNLSNLTWLFLADELDSGRIDTANETSLATLLLDKFNGDLSFLSAAGLIYPTTERLVMKVLTGLAEIPKPIETVIPDPENKDLLGQLAQDPATAGISYLTKHLIAALNIPMHSQGSGEQPFGGISDITNKGSYDKLLLSELAQDEELLTARLVNSEALYFKREEPPEDVDRKRVILLDTTLKMWGKPRMFGISAALACTLNTKHGEAIEAYALEGDYYQSIDFGTTKGILHSLQQLNPALHCGKALSTLINEQNKTDSDEYIFITGDWQHQPYDFQALFSNTKTVLNFIISVGRDGDLNLYECINGNAKLLNTTKFDLEEILFQKAQVGKKAKPQKKYLDTRIAFLNQAESPLYFPTPQSLRLTTDRAFFIYINYKEGNVVAVYDDQRLLYWEKRGRGAIELLDQIELGEYYFGKEEDNNKIYILVIQHEEEALILYSLDTVLVQLEKVVFANSGISPELVIFENGSFIILSGNQKIEINCSKEAILPPVAADKTLKNNTITGAGKLESYARKIVSNGYNTLNRFETICIQKGLYSGERLAFDRNELESSDHIIFGDPSKHKHYKERTVLIIAIASDDIFEIQGKPKIKFKKFEWDDGSQIIIDSRGLAHLISSNEALPQVTLVLISGKTIACWASDGSVCGSEYFVPPESEQLPMNEFYKKYIQSYIDRIIEVCS